MRVHLFTASCVLALSLPLLSADPASAQIYAWRDPEGRLVLSNRAEGASPVYVSGSYGAATDTPTDRPAPVRGRGYNDIIETHAGTNGVSPDLVRAVIQVESGFNPRAVSPKGAMGLMQLMPSTASEFRVANPFDPAENIRGGVAYLRQLLDRYDGRVELALAAYNAGPGAVDRYGAQVPPYRETREYVRKIKSITPIRLGPSKIIYKIVEVIDGREVPRYSDKKPSGEYEVVTRR